MSSDRERDDLRLAFDGEQLRAARELRLLTQAALARAAVATKRTNALTSAAVSQFELGETVPTTTTLLALAEALDVEPEFLTTPDGDGQTDLPAFFRSLRGTPAADRKRARNVVQLVHRLAVALHTHVGLAARDVPAIPCDPFAQQDERRSQAEAAAEAVRARWALPAGPIANVVAAIEEHGVVCTRLPFGEQRVDAFSVNFDDHPVAVLATDKDKWDRSRFDAAHELGHLVMHDGYAAVPEAERQAHEFAAAFLMPASEIKDVLPARADWQALTQLKATWGVSMAALLLRSKTLGVMSDSAYLTATKMMSARGWRRHEPVDGTPERPSMLWNALGRAQADGVRLDQLRAETHIPLDIFEAIWAASNHHIDTA